MLLRERANNVTAAIIYIGAPQEKLRERALHLHACGIRRRAWH